MIPLGKIRTVALLAMASVGLLGGHSLTYLKLAPSGGSRASLLEASGHGYLDKGVVFAGAMAIMAVLFWLADGALKRTSRPSTAGVAVALGLVQVLGFGAQEVLERLLAGATLRDLSTVLLVGIPLQLLVAAVGALLVTFLHRAGARIAELLSSSPSGRRQHPTPPLVRTFPFSSAALAGGLGSRGPPPLLSR
ncbi:MAG TPA: hypothetical protein VHJ78_07050 [Actinomycetota bacterium]|nr:hypothetical protein [Actinomycetota bacterium]